MYLSFVMLEQFSKFYFRPTQQYIRSKVLEDDAIIEVMIYLPGASWLMLVLGALLSETDTYHHTSQLLLQDGKGDEDLWQVWENLKKEKHISPAKCSSMPQNREQPSGYCKECHFV